ncbi:TetR family transcriptional regulator [Paenibacillus sp. J31TS4]|uniref:TetR/AcrR family transcriptional regulator n=1 Tax=Paenibacillus sp. J31TS4 TaxID=2807195 RepID=UPI001B0FB318|nr:TetR/AcrR family transcriptional regulator [Paenibacillus sp. J31TS4]GIP38421.1 TetR family transcriptional regulator [Paenibacillus sp. J31TS4]
MNEELKERIVQEAADLFNAKGYRNVTLSELASRLGISKKTLYLSFRGKEDIAEAVLGLTMRAIADTIAEQRKRDAGPLARLRDVFLGIKQEMMKLHPVFLEDIQKAAPALWKRVEAFRGRQLLFVEELLLQAKEAGEIRDLDIRLVSVILLDTIQRLIRPDFAAQHGVTMPHVADTLFSLFLEGLRNNPEK